MKTTFVGVLIILLVTISTWAQQRSVLGLVCRSGKAQYATGSSWKYFSIIELPANGRVKLVPGTKLDVYELIPSKKASGFWDDGRRYTYTYKGQRAQASILTENDLRNGLRTVPKPTVDKPNFLTNLIYQLFNSRDMPDTQMGDQGGSPRGKTCPPAKLVSAQMESLFVSDSIHLQWSSDTANKTYLITFYPNDTTQDDLMKPVLVSDTSLHLRTDVNIFKSGEVYYWSVRSIGPASACERNAFRVLTALEKTSIDSRWDQINSAAAYSAPLRLVFQAEYYALNGLYYLANQTYNQLGSNDNLTPEIILLRQRFLHRMRLTGVDKY